MPTIHAPELEYTGAHGAPHYATSGAAGFDLTADLVEPLVLEPGAWSPIPTGLRVRLPHGYEMQVRPRSGLALKYGVTVLNAPGTVDADYADEVLVLLINHGREPFTVNPGERIAQGVIARYVRVPELVTAATKTRAGGFGSTGR